MKLRRAFGLCLALTACGSDHRPEVAEGDAGLDARMPAPGEAGVVIPPDGSRPGAARAARIVSVPPSYVVAGDRFRYQVRSSNKSASLEMDGAPAGMVARGNMVRWTPTEQQSGSHTMSVRSLGAMSAANAAQEITLKVSTSTLRASEDIDPETGGGVYSDNPSRARMLGAGVYVPPRSVAATTRMTVGELDSTPATPNASGRATAVRFGPEGQTFDTPARITLPLPEASARSASRMNVYVYSKARWQRAPLVALDLINGLATARVSHFSVYAAIESKVDLALTFAETAEASACPNGIVAQAQIASPLSDLELASLNNLPEALRAMVPGEAPMLEDLVKVPGFSGSVRVVQVFDLVQSADDSEVVLATQLIASTLYLAPDGSGKLTHTDALGNVLGSVSYPQALLKLDEISTRMRGTATAVHFDDLLADDLGVGARVHLLYFAGDATDEPLNVDDLGIAAVERAPVFTTADGIPDGDCDGVLDAFDDGDDRLLPAVEASPRAVVSALAGDEVKLKARTRNGTPSAEAWTVLSGDGATLSGEGDTRVFKASGEDRYLVSYRATVDGQNVEHVFAIDVTAMPAENTPPTCRPTRDVDVGRVGDAFPLSAQLDDEETPTSALKVQWGLLDGDQLTPSAAIHEHPGKALFAPLDAGNYVVACRAFDGAMWGPIGSVKVSVVPKGQNRAPTDLTLSPAVSLVKLGDTIKLHASARDPDGDPLLFTWFIDGNPTPSTTSGKESQLTYTPGQEGVLDVVVEVLDGTTRVSTKARIVVGQITGALDVDKDGWNAGNGPADDCNDNDASIHPGKFDECGDDIDRDCDGVIAKEDCDSDGYSIARGDCNDNDAAISPQATELCDGVDNDCNLQIDEGFRTGGLCTSGLGACATPGKIECASDGLSALCTAKPLAPQLEICDRIDNDCDGFVDEGACVTDAGVAPVDATTVTVDASIGACVPTSETCNQLDDDCNGAVDDIEAKQCNTGLLGACAAGYYGCTANGSSCVPQTYGKTETCNQIDDDCNGKVDDGISCSCNPTFGELCGDQIDNDCDGKIDEDCTQSCTPGAQEYCFNGADDDCDGKIDDQDSDCCVPTGAEDCNDGKDNDCDLYVDAKDTDCAIGVAADNCQKPGTIQLSQWTTGYFDGARPDLRSCVDGRADLVYAFSIKDEGEYVLITEGQQVLGWSIQEGACDGAKVSLNELSCGKPAQLRPGNYFLVLEGPDKGSFTVMLSPQYPK